MCAYIYIYKPSLHIPPEEVVVGGPNEEPQPRLKPRTGAATEDRAGFTALDSAMESGRPWGREMAYREGSGRFTYLFLLSLILLLLL